MTAAELANFLNRKPEIVNDNTCSHCGGYKKRGYRLCYKCHERGQRFTHEAEMRKGEKRNEKLAEQLGERRKNQHKGRIVNRLMSPSRQHEDSALPPDPVTTPKPKTILRKRSD